VLFHHTDRMRITERSDKVRHWLRLRDYNSKTVVRCTPPPNSPNRLECIARPATADQQPPDRQVQLQPTVRLVTKTRQQAVVLR
jgi:hypothetical protein